jgi:hypothetical protein
MFVIFGVDETMVRMKIASTGWKQVKSFLYQDVIIEATIQLLYPITQELDIDPLTPVGCFQRTSM